MAIEIQIDGRAAADKLKRAFAHLTDTQYKHGVSLALNVTARKVRTLTAKEIRSVYNIRYSYLTSKLMPIGKANPGKLQSTISLSTKPIPLGEFIKSKANKQGVKVEIVKGQPKTLKGAFLFKSHFSSSPRLSVMHRSNVQGNSSYNNSSFQFRHKRLTTGSDLPIGAVFSVSPLHSIFNHILQKNITNAGGVILERQIERMLDAKSNNVIRDARRYVR